MTAAQGVAAGNRTGYPQIISQTPQPLGHLSPHKKSEVVFTKHVLVVSWPFDVFKIFLRRLALSFVSAAYLTATLVGV